MIHKELISESLKTLLANYEALYDSFDGAHDRHHMEIVRQRAVELAEKYLPNKIVLAYVAATLHDVGLSVERENHEEMGAQIILKDDKLRQIIGDKDLEIVANAVREHRASSGSPQTTLAKIISDSDRGADNPYEVVRRPMEYGLAHFPNLSEDEQYKRAGDQLTEKFHDGGSGRRYYFPETEARLVNLYKPIIEAYRSEGIQALRRIYSLKRCN